MIICPFVLWYVLDMDHERTQLLCESLRDDDGIQGKRVADRSIPGLYDRAELFGICWYAKELISM